MPIGSDVAGQRGFTYMGLLLFIAIAGIALAVIGPVWHTEAQREKEKELLFVGDQMAQAIASYFQSTPGDVKQYPASLEDLLEDKRFPVIRRHLRRIYPDPMTGSTEWGLVKQQGRLVGLYSLSKDRPLKQDGFPERLASFSHAKSYQDWSFVYTAVAGVVGTVATATPDAAPAAPSLGSVTPGVALPAIVAPTPQASPKTKNAACSNKQSSETDQCRDTCGDLAGETCQSCFAASFEHFRACQQGP